MNFFFRLFVWQFTVKIAWRKIHDTVTTQRTKITSQQVTHRPLSHIENRALYLSSQKAASSKCAGKRNEDEEEDEMFVVADRGASSTAAETAK